MFWRVFTKRRELVVFSQVWRSRVYSSGRRPCKFNEFRAVVEFYFVESTFIVGINFLVAVPTTLCCGLQATRPLKDHPSNTVAMAKRKITRWEILWFPIPRTRNWRANSTAKTNSRLLEIVSTYHNKDAMKVKREIVCWLKEIRHSKWHNRGRPNPTTSKPRK